MSAEGCHEGPCLRRRYWVTVNTGAILNATTAPITVDARTIRALHPGLRRWRLQQFQYIRDATTTTGNLVVTGVAADGKQMYCDVVLGASQTAFDLFSLLPEEWSGQVTFTVENRTGATSTFYIALGFEPILEDS